MVFIEQMQDCISHDPEWRAWAKIISNYTVLDDIKFGCDHGMNHWIRVSRIAADFARKTGGNDHEIHLVTIAGLLHDCGMICGEERHAENGACIARPYLQAHWGNLSPLSEADIRIICHAIAHHSDCTEINNIVDAALMFADKVDITRNRLVSIHNDVQRCVSQIERVDYDITDTELGINYVTDDDFDYNYFLTNWPKAHEVPARIAAWLNRDFLFFINDQRIILPK